LKLGEFSGWEGDPVPACLGIQIATWFCKLNQAGTGSPFRPENFSNFKLLPGKQEVVRLLRGLIVELFVLVPGLEKKWAKSA
jgi:hypothetical protein